MNVDKGKADRITFTFLGREYDVSKVPVGIAAPFSVEMNKLRVLTLKAAEAVAMSDDNLEDMGTRTVEYFTKFPEQAHAYNVQCAKVVSVFTEFFSEGEVTEEYILHHADADETNDFVMALQEAVNAPLKKRLEKLTKEAIPLQ